MRKLKNQKVVLTPLSQLPYCCYWLRSQREEMHLPPVQIRQSYKYHLVKDSPHVNLGNKEQETLKEDPTVTLLSCYSSPLFLN